MFKLYTDAAIDMVQSSKKMFVDTFVKNENLSKSLHKFVDTQTEYTKKAVDTFSAVATDVYKTVTDKNFVAESLKTVKDSVKEFTGSKDAK